MKELGFLIDREGNLYPYGKWVEYGKAQKDNRSHYHDTSFEDEVSHLAEFKRLGLPYDKKVRISFQAREFAKHGVIALGNYKINDNEGFFLMCSPNELSDKQKMQLKNLYSTLADFDEQYIEVSNINNNSIIKFDSIDEYFEVFEIEHPIHTVKTM